MLYSQIVFHGQSVTVENGPTGPIATGWQDGLPLYRKPITLQQLETMLDRFPDHAIR